MAQRSTRLWQGGLHLVLIVISSRQSLLVYQKPSGALAMLNVFTLTHIVRAWELLCGLASWSGKAMAAVQHTGQ
jgi:hypothetical protein